MEGRWSESDRGEEGPLTSRIYRKQSGGHRGWIIEESGICEIRWLLDETDKIHFWGKNEPVKNDTVVIVTSFIAANHIAIFIDHNLAVAIKIELFFKVTE